MVYKRPYTRMNRGRPAAKRASKRVARTRGLTRKVPSRKPGLHPFVVAQGNPFHSAAIGVKIPDLNNLPSCTVLARNMYALTGNTTQGSAAVFGTLPKYAYDVCKTDGSGTFTSWDWTSLTTSPTYQNIDQYNPNPNPNPNPNVRVQMGPLGSKWITIRVTIRLVSRREPSTNMSMLLLPRRRDQVFSHPTRNPQGSVPRSGSSGLPFCPKSVVSDPKFHGWDEKLNCTAGT